MSQIGHAVLMCHAPIVIPAVAGARAAACESSTRAMREAAALLVDRAVDAVVVVSPHSPRHPTQFTVATADPVRGDFSRFGAARVRVDLPNPPALVAALEAAAARETAPLAPVPPFDLDHGAAVPLAFLVEAGWRGPTLVLGLPWHGDLALCRRVGRAIASAAEDVGQRWGLLASGDMSHRLTRDAPSGYEPRAAEFDRWITEHVSVGDHEGAVGVDGRLRRLAAEDVVDSLAVAIGACGGNEGHRTLSYEGPFGVGYLVAVLRDIDAGRAP